jgi:phosphopantothenoylcysteine decarboxylase/phosphopantothenate--cysteine ligase
MHPSEGIRGATSQRLADRRIVLGVTGSIAAVKTVELARALIRHGADVLPVMTPAATDLVGPWALEFATGRDPVTELTGATEHVTEVGSLPDDLPEDADPGDVADLFLVAPATGNTVSKMALGVDDTPVTTFATTGLATTPTLVAPAMHASMEENPFVAENLDRLREAGVTVVEPLREEGKAKLAPVEALVEWVLRETGPKPLEGVSILVATGSTVEDVDDMRVVTNKSTGRMGVELAREAFRRGADVTLLLGHAHVEGLPPTVPIQRFRTGQDLLDRADELPAYDAVLVPAAVSDYAPRATDGKIPSRQDGLTLEMEELPKVVEAWRDAYDGLLVPFKAESEVSDKELVEEARKARDRLDAPFVVANDLREVDVDETRVVVVGDGDPTPASGTKAEVAGVVLDALAEAAGEA